MERLVHQSFWGQVRPCVPHIVWLPRCLWLPSCIASVINTGIISPELLLTGTGQPSWTETKELVLSIERQEQWARARAHPEQISTQSQHAARCNWNQSGGKCVLFCQNMKYSFNLYSVRLIQTSLPRIQLTSKGTSKVPNGLRRDSFYKIKQKPR